MTSTAQRQAVIVEARTWLKTPYHHAAAVKGAGVDCLMLLAQVYQACGLIEPPVIPYYPMDVMMHRGHETYLDGVLHYAHQVDAPQPGDIALWKFGRMFSHAGIVVAWPEIIHAYRQEGCVLGRGDQGEFAGREVRFYSLWAD